MSTCRGFQWIGQSFSSCEGCDQDLVDHDGLQYIGEVLPFGEAEARIALFRLQVTPIDGDPTVRRYHESQRGAS